MNLRRVHDNTRGPSASILALNDSFVLHEPSSSRAVADHVARQTRRRVDRRSYVPPASVLGIGDVRTIRPDVVLTAQIGNPLALQDLLKRLDPPPAVVTIEQTSSATTSREFFRAPASLALPATPADRLVVAAVVERPGGSTFQLAMSGPYCWPDDEHRALRALEDLIRAYVDQWSPGRALWAESAEQLLPEVLSGDPSTPYDPG